MKRLQVLWLAVALGCGGSSGAPTPPPEPPVLKSGQIGTWMGDGTQGFDGDGHTPAETWLNQPMDLSFDGGGRAYLVDWNNHRIRRLESDGKVHTLIGRDLPGDWDCQDPANPANCAVAMTATVKGADVGLNHPMALKFGPDGLGYLAAWHNHKIEAFTTDGIDVHIVSGQQAPGYVGDGGPAAAARLNFVDSVAVDGHGNVYLGDERNRRVRRIAADDARTITDVAGTSPAPAASGFAGDGGPATQARLALAPYTVVDGADNPPPGGALAIGSDGTLYVSDTFNHCVRQISPGSDGVVGDGDPAEEIITTLAGQCTTPGFAGDGGAAAAALLNLPEDLEFGPDGKLYLADTGNHVVRRIDLATGTIDRVAGTGQRGFAGDFGAPLDARLWSPYGLAFDAAGNLYIADTLNNRIRIILK
jgi:sugar lactone lactonase YvrE